MEDNENILKKAIEAIKNEPIPNDPPQNVVDATLAKLSEASGGQTHVSEGRQIHIWDRFTISNNLLKLAAALILFIFVGFSAGRFTGPQPVDTEQLKSEIEASLRASLEPAIRNQVLSDTKQYLQVGLVNCYAQLKDDLSQQYRQDLYQVSAQTLAASSTATNQLLADLIESINVAQTQDRQWVTASMEQLELNRRRDTAQLRNAVEELYNTQPNSLIPNKLENNNIN